MGDGGAGGEGGQADAARGDRGELVAEGVPRGPGGSADRGDGAGDGGPVVTRDRSLRRHLEQLEIQVREC